MSIKQSPYAQPVYDTRAPRLNVPSFAGDAAGLSDAVKIALGVGIPTLVVGGLGFMTYEILSTPAATALATGAAADMGANATLNTNLTQGVSPQDIAAYMQTHPGVSAAQATAYLQQNPQRATVAGAVPVITPRMPSVFDRYMTPRNGGGSVQ